MSKFSWLTDVWNIESLDYESQLETLQWIIDNFISEEELKERLIANWLDEDTASYILEFAVQDLSAFMSNGNWERIRDFMNTSNITLISKLESLSHYSGSLDVTINPDKSVTSWEVRFTSSEMSVISAYYSTY